MINREEWEAKASARARAREKVKMGKNEAWWGTETQWNSHTHTLRILSVQNTITHRLNNWNELSECVSVPLISSTNAQPPITMYRLRYFVNCKQFRIANHTHTNPWYIALCGCLFLFVCNVDFGFLLWFDYGIAQISFSSTLPVCIHLSFLTFDFIEFFFLFCTHFWRF